MELKDYVFNGICGPRSPAFEAKEVSCNFEFGSCAWTAFDKPHFKWKLGSGDPSSQMFLEKFNSPTKPGTFTFVHIVTIEW